MSLSPFTDEKFGEKGGKRPEANLVMQPSFPASALFLQSLVLSTLVSALETKGF